MVFPAEKFHSETFQILYIFKWENMQNPFDQMLVELTVGCVNVHCYCNSICVAQY